MGRAPLREFEFTHKGRRLSHRKTVERNKRDGLDQGAGRTENARAAARRAIFARIECALRSAAIARGNKMDSWILSQDTF